MQTWDLNPPLLPQGLIKHNPSHSTSICCRRVMRHLFHLREFNSVCVRWIIIANITQGAKKHSRKQSVLASDEDIKAIRVLCPCKEVKRKNIVFLALHCSVKKKKEKNLESSVQLFLVSCEHLAVRQNGLLFCILHTA